jgi:DNA-binding GntR family transcriptional regulator
MPEATRRYLEADREFHWHLVELSGNEQLVRTIRSVNLLIFSYQRGLVRPMEETLPEHLAIIDGLRRRDPDVCEQLLRHHFRQSYERFTKEAQVEEAEQAQALETPPIPRRMQQPPRREGATLP